MRSMNLRYPLVFPLVLAIGCTNMGLVALAPEAADTGLHGAVLGIEPPGDIGFGNVSYLGDGARKEVVLYAAGDEMVAVLDVRLDDGTSSAFSIRDDLPLPMRIKPGHEFPVTVTFAPQHGGQFEGHLVVEVDNGTPDGLDVKRRLLGVGCDPEHTDGSCR